MNRDTCRQENEEWNSGDGSRSGDGSSPMKLFSESLQCFRDVEPEVIH